MLYARPCNRLLVEAIGAIAEVGVALGVLVPVVVTQGCRLDQRLDEWYSRGGVDPPDR